MTQEQNVDNILPNIEDCPQKELIDDAFYLNQTKYKVWHSFSKDATPLITSLDKDHCIAATRFYLKACQEGWWEQKSIVEYDGTVGGKL